jgi:hypothetical protein
MSERPEPIPASPAGEWKKDLIALGLLLVLVLPLRLWLLSSAVATSRDGIGFIRIALELEQMPWQDVCVNNQQHPGYPLAILCAWDLVRGITGQAEPDAVSLQFAAQLASMLASVLLVIPMYHLGRLLFDRRIGIGAALLFQYLPTSGHHISDGISEAVFLLFVACGLWQAVRALNRRSLPSFAWCGIFTALAYLTRPEGALILIGVTLALLGLQCAPALRLSRQRLVVSGATLLLAWLLVSLPYMVAIGGPTNKWSVRLVIKWLTGVPPANETAAVLPKAGPHGGPLFAASFPHSDHTTVQLRRSVWALTLEISNGFHYVGVVPAALGLFWCFGSLRRQPGFWAVAVFTTIHIAILLALARTVNYVSDRHVMVLVLCGSYFAVAGLVELPRRLLSVRATPPRSFAMQPAFWSLILFMGLIGFCLPKTLQPLHINRLGNREAGFWLQSHLRPGDIVDDDHCWSHYYAGQVFLEGHDPVLPVDASPHCYVVITRADHRDIGEKRRQAEETLREQQAELVYYWPTTGTADAARVVVYMRPRDPEREGWQVQH